ncbi:ATP-binding protein [Caldithrix abyssi]
MILKESETVELKKSTSSLKQALISILAILNKHGGGELYFGVENSGQVVGQQVTESTLRQISQKISEGIEPKIFPLIEKVNFQGKVCIRIQFEGRERPYFAFGVAYIRVADEDRKLSPNELKRFIFESDIYSRRCDTELTDLPVEMIEKEVFNEFLSRAKEVNRLKLSTVDWRQNLNKLNLIKNGKLTHAAKFLFTGAHDIEIQCAVFAGADRVTFLDFKKFEGNLFLLLEAAENYIKEKINWRVEFDETMKRKEVPEIPLAAVREALVNSLVHRDFANPKGNEIAIFKDRVEIYNPGTFPPGLKPEDFISGKERSYLRNPKIAEIFYFTKDIERWGSGLERIHKACLSNGVTVKFNLLKTGFLVTFERPELKSKDYGRTVEKTVGKTVEKILHAIKENPEITTLQLAELLGLSRRGIEWNLARLKKQGKIKRIGPARGGHWQVVEK